MNRFRLFLTLSCLAGAASTMAADNPLAPEELAECANLALELRTTSPWLHREALESSRRRSELSEMHARLDAGSEGDTDRWLRYNAAAAAFNQRMQQFRADVIDINEVKNRYKSSCDGRPYDTKDLDLLPQAQQEAMRQGMADVVVPFLAPQ